MTPLRVCLNYLDGLGIRYRYVSDTAAREVNVTQAAEDEFASNNIARTFVLKGVSGYILVAIPDESHLDLGKVRAMIGCNALRFASEAEIVALFPEGDVAAVPPLSGLVGTPVYVDIELANQRCLAFRACSRHDLVCVKTDDLKRMLKTSVGSFSEPDYQLEFRNRLLAKATSA